MIAHSFTPSLTRGLDAEAVIDRHLTQDYMVTPATKQEQLLGIDRHLLHRRTRQSLTVEIKADFRAAETKNIFVELFHHEDDGNLWTGWAIASEADVLLLLIPQSGCCYWVPMSRIRLNLMNWNNQFSKRTIRNHGQRGIPFNTQGILVPMGAIAQLAEKVFKVKS